MRVYEHHLTKVDGRPLILYALAPIDPALTAPSAGTAPPAGSHLRWHPLRGEWVVYAGHRQNRTFLPPPSWNPLAPTTDPAHPTEVPAGAWDVAVFQNLYSALGSATGTAPSAIVETQVCGGTTEVIVFDQDPTASLSTLPLERLELVLHVWGDRTKVLGRRSEVAYVFPFENRGTQVGATLAHPHGQIYAYPFVPPQVERSLELQRRHHESHRQGLLAQLIQDELADDRRTLFVGPHATAFVPVCARWAYEIWVAPLRPVPALWALTDAERLDLATALQVALRKLDGLWQRPMPYVLAVHQAPTHGEHPYAHAHIEIYPWLRMPDRIKFLAGSEVGAGVFTADTLPEDTAARLRAVTT